MRESLRRLIARHAAALAFAGLAWSTLPILPTVAGYKALESPIAGEARVIDGDTIQIGETRIRLEGIDAPETGQTCGRKWAGNWRCGEAATEHLAGLVKDQPVRCEPRGTDRYGRYLGVCFAGAIELNADLVRQGLAWAFIKYSRAYVEVEAEARALRVGIWQGDATPPWEFRRLTWTGAEQEAPGGCAIKGNVTRNGQIYHMPWSPWYAQIRIEPDKGKRWFCSEDEALAAGWRPAMSR